MGFRAHLIEKMQTLVGVHYQLHSNKADCLKTLQTNGIFLNLDLDEIYEKIIRVLQLILLILFSQNWPIYRTRDYSYHQIFFLL